MKRMNARTARFAAVILLAAAAIGLAAYAVARVAFFRAQIEARRSELAVLSDLDVELRQQRAAFDAIAAHHDPASRLESVVRAALPDTRIDLVLRETSPAGEGWSVKRYDLRLESVPSARLGAFLAACENARPRIRLLDVQVSVPAGAAGLNAQLALAELAPAGLVSTP